MSSKFNLPEGKDKIHICLRFNFPLYDTMAEPKYDVSDDRSKGDKVKLLPKSDAFGAVDGFPSLSPMAKTAKRQKTIFNSIINWTSTSVHRS